MVLKVGPWLIPDIYLIYSYPPFLFLPVEKKKHKASMIDV